MEFPNDAAVTSTVSGSVPTPFLENPVKDGNSKKSHVNINAIFGAASLQENVLQETVYF